MRRAGVKWVRNWGVKFLDVCMFAGAALVIGDPLRPLRTPPSCLYARASNPTQSTLQTLVPYTPAWHLEEGWSITVQPHHITFAWLYCERAGPVPM